MKTRKKIILSYKESSPELKDDLESNITITNNIDKYKTVLKDNYINIKEEIEIINNNIDDNVDNNFCSNPLEIENGTSYLLPKQSSIITKIGDKCKFIGFFEGFLKLFVNDQSYFCNRTCDNIFYWQCDHDKDCISQAVTMLVNEEHWLKSIDEHIHPIAKQNIKDQFDIEHKRFYEKCKWSKFNDNQIKLIRNGYFYKNITNSNNIYYWLCENNNSCNGKLVTILKSNEHFVKFSTNHNHLNDLTKYNYIGNEDETVFQQKSCNFIDSSIFETDNYELSIPEENIEFKQEENCYSNDDVDYEYENDDDNDDDVDGNQVENEDPLNVELVDGDIVCDFVPSNQGKPKLCLNGYVYNQNRTNNKQIHWNCEDKKSLKCYGIAVTEICNEKHYLKKSREHNHPPNTNRKIIGKTLNRIKHNCLTLTEISPSEIIDNELLKIPEVIRKSMPRRNALLQMINRKRRVEELNNGTDFKYKPKPSSNKKRKINITTCDSIGKVCEMVESTKGNGKLIVEDFIFTLNKTNNNLYYWCCDKKKSMKCTSYAVTNLLNGEHNLKKLSGEHNHEVNPNRKIVARIMKLIKNEALITDENPTKIIEDAVQGLDEEILKILPSKQSILRTINRHRSVHKNDGEIIEHKTKVELNESTHLFQVNMNIGTECNIFTPTNKGNLKLNLNGYFYHKNRIKNDLHYWQCEESRINHCRGFATTYVNVEDGKHYIKNVKNHNHPPEERRQDVADILFKIKEKSRTTDLDATIIWNDDIANLPEDLKKLMPQRTAVMTMINRTRRKNMDPDELELSKKIEYDEEQEHIYEIHKNPDTECELLPSLNGPGKLVIEGFLFTRNKVYNNLHKWRCDEQNKDTANCRGYATTILKDDGKHYLKNVKNHNHPANTNRVEIATLINKIKERARTTQDLSTKIYDDEITTTSDIIKKCLPNRESILALINRHRRKLLEQKKNPPKNLIKLETLIEDHFHEPFVEPGSEVEIITSHKGTCKLNLNSYLYVKNVVKNNVHYWQCDEKNSNHCRGHATTLEKTNGKHYLRTTRAHNHLAKAGNHREIADVMNRIKEICLLRDDGPKRIYADVVENLPKELKAVLPSLQAITMVIKRHRRKFRPLDKSGLNFQPQKIYPPEIIEIIDRMKHKILTTTDGPARIYNAEIANLSVEIRSQLPKRENLLQTLKRTRRKNRKNPKEEASASDDDEGEEINEETTTLLPPSVAIPSTISVQWWASS